MVNSTLSSLPIVLEAYLALGRWKYLGFVLLLLLYVLTVASNLLLTAVICLSRSLHQPMYVLLCSLFVNELYGSTALVPFLLLQILSDLHAVSAPFCFLQIFCVYTYVNVEFCTLAVMAYDRFVAICQPLQYHLRMSLSRTLLLVFVLWLYSFLKCLSTLALSLQLQRCGVAINSLYCHNYLVVKLSCSDTRVNNIYGLLGIVVSVLVPLVLILFSYLRILQVCFSGSRQTRQKAVSTCSPQLVSLLNFALTCLLEIVQTRLSLAGLPRMLRNVLSLYFYLLQPLMTPVMFGLQVSAIRSRCKAVLWPEKLPRRFSK
ncbi:unnamed protein product [Tetraodon nigroviridis]|nr:unnamed protein product [Tetraodon nigroviridis]